LGQENGFAEMDIGKGVKLPFCRINRVSKKPFPALLTIKVCFQHASDRCGKITEAGCTCYIKR